MTTPTRGAKVKVLRLCIRIYTCLFSVTPSLSPRPPSVCGSPVEWRAEMSSIGTGVSGSAAASVGGIRLVSVLAVRPLGRPVLPRWPHLSDRVRKQSRGEQRVSAHAHKSCRHPRSRRTAVAIRGKDGVVFAVEKLVTSKLHERSVNRRICTVDRHVGVVSCRVGVVFCEGVAIIPQAITGLFSDARKVCLVGVEGRQGVAPQSCPQVVGDTRQEASKYRARYSQPIPLKVVTTGAVSYSTMYLPPLSAGAGGPHVLLHARPHPLQWHPPLWLLSDVWVLLFLQWCPALHDRPIRSVLGAPEIGENHLDRGRIS